MTPEELATVAQVAAALWPHADVGERFVAGCAMVLADAGYDETVDALRRLSLTGREFPPPPGVIATTVRRLESLRLADEALAAADQRRAALRAAEGPALARHTVVTSWVPFAGEPEELPDEHDRPRGDDGG